MNKLKVGIIGTGFSIGIAKRHVEAYQANERVELVAAYDIIPGRAAKWLEGKKVEGVTVCDTMEQLFDMVDAVSVCTPNNTHIDLTIKAIEAGKHVICEKPFALNCEEAEKAVEVGKAHPEVVSMICFNYREIPAIKYMKKIIDEGKIGNVFTVRQKLGGARMSDPTVKLEWRMQEQLSGTGALADFGCHMIDLVDYLLTETQGKMCEVSGSVSTFVKERTLVNDENGKGLVTNDDSAVFFARSENGALYNFTASRASKPGHYFEISGEGGYLIYDSEVGEDKVEVWLKDKNGAYKKDDKAVVDVPAEMLGEENHKGLINAFVKAVLDGKVDNRNLDRGLYIQYLTDMIKKASDEKRTIVL